MEMDSARCPKCNELSWAPMGERVFYCHECQMPFETEDDGIIGYEKPDRRAIREEEWKRKRKGGRR